MDSSNIFIAVVAVVLLLIAWRKGNGTVAKGLRLAYEHTVVNMPRVFFALLGAGFISEILPKDIIGSWLGHNSGLTGIMLASVVGLIMPGGPIIAFPIVVALAKTGAGFPALVTFLTSWSLLGLQRVFTFELTMMGSRFVINRMIGAFILTPLTGITAWGMQWLLGVP